ncbi:alpha/beta hydrolase [Clostridium sp. E02]|uniref:alpha/beta fold hydrolase n=1 Tax=Clostridium sp. E02 TaxID=2487134 RepID=UPI000F54552D|nr:alpha/beta hydrolase [Clostridium sp. E02]
MYITVNGIRLYYEVSGRGPAMILVHGNGEDHKIFKETANLLHKDYTVYSMDSRGHGKSAGKETISYEQMAEDVAEFVRILKLNYPIYCGFSDGAIIGILAAVKHPKLFSKMVICGANAYPEGLKRRWLIFYGFLALVFRDPRVRMMLREPKISGKELEQIAVPTLVLAGEKDMVRHSHTVYLASKIKNSCLRILAGETHGSYVVHSKKLYCYMEKFLKNRV